jgi:hypothetical protein
MANKFNWEFHCVESADWEGRNSLAIMSIDEEVTAVWEGTTTWEGADKTHGMSQELAPEGTVEIMMDEAMNRCIALGCVQSKI